MSLPSTPSPAAHTSPRRTITEGTGGHLVRFWAMLSPHLATDRPAASDHRAAPRAVCHPARLVLFPVPLFCLLPSTVHTLARSSLPSSSAVSVILRPDLVRSLSSVRPSVFLFLVPRSPSCRLTAKPTPAAHYLTSAHPRQGRQGSPGSGRDTIATTSTPTSNRDGRTSARPSARLSLPVWYVVRVGRPPSRAGHPFPLTLPTLSTLPWCAWAYGC